MAPGVPQAEREMEIRSNRVRIFSKSPENECQALLTDVRKEFTRVLSTNITQDYCSLQIQVLRDKTAELDTILKKYDIDRIDTDTENIYKSYTETSDRVIELEKSLTENEARIAETKTAYDALLAQSGNRTLNAETIDAISKAIRNKAELIDSFSDKKRNLMAQIDALKKQKADYEDAVKYVTYQLNVEKRVIIDSEAIGERWYADIRELSNTFQETLRNVTVNLLSFLLRAFGVVIYIVIGGILVLGGGRIGWKMARRIL